MKEKILLVNKFYYRRGGDCVVTMNLEQLLRNHGHEVAVFAMKYPENLPSQWSDMFASEIDFGGGIAEKLRATRRTMGFGDISRSFKSVLDRFNPDVVHLHNIHSYLSPV
ncbi:MAG: glycosyltransferase, partial [Muribaculum sp.]|nr:glycosyltransferase [Muribaculum sp.]